LWFSGPYTGTGTIAGQTSALSILFQPAARVEKPGSATIQRSVPAMEIIATNALISINETFLVQLGSFLIFLYVMNRIMFRPLLGTIAQRKDHIAEFKEKIQTGKEDLDRLSRDLDRERSEIVKEANMVVMSLEAEGDQRASEIVADVLQQISQLRQETERR
jgi:F-type H+-transporting ATPase subunit b